LHQLAGDAGVFVGWRHEVGQSAEGRVRRKDEFKWQMAKGKIQMVYDLPFIKSQTICHLTFALCHLNCFFCAKG
jgi:adenine C2-methylase RlmN of 23S rRNA A2503 and tRNA A37